MENTVGQRIDNIIKALSITKTEFCSKINVASTVIYNILNGRNKPSYDLIGKIINTFNVDPNYLLKGTGEMFISNVNISDKIQTVKMNTDFESTMNTTNEKNVSTRREELPETLHDKTRENNNLSMKYDIIESNKEFFSEYMHGMFSEMKEYHWEYLQIRYYEPMSIHRLKTLYSSEIESLRAVYNSRMKLVEILHYLKAADFLLEKFPLPPDFKEYLKEVENEWNDDFESLKDKKLELILKIIHVKEDSVNQSDQLAKLINYMSMYKEELKPGKR